MPVGKMRINGVVGANAKADIRASPDTAEYTLNISRDDGACCGCRRRLWWLLAGTLIVFVVVTAVVVATTWTSGPDGEHYSTRRSERHTVQDGEQLTRFQLPIVPRANWSHRPAADLPVLAHPTPFVVIKHTAGPQCYGLSECGRYLRDVQELHWQQVQQPEISYNFLIDSVGNVYEGRGWNTTNVSKGPVYRCNVDVALIGNYVDHDMTEPMTLALRLLLDQGVSEGMLTPDYLLLAHNQVSNTVSPGQRALETIKNFPHRCLNKCFEGVQCPKP